MVKLKIRTQPTKGVVLKDNVDANELRLVPYTNNVVLNGAGSVPTGGSVYVCNAYEHKGKMNSVWLNAPRLNVVEDQGQIANRTSEPFIIPYWLVYQTPDNARGNMVAATVSVDGVHIPILTNKCALNAGTELMIYKPKRQSDAPPAGPPRTKARTLAFMPAAGCSGKGGKGGKGGKQNAKGKAKGKA